MADNKEKRDYRQELTDLLIRKLEEGTAPWLKPWEPGKSGVFPHNPTTNKPYRGINALHLGLLSEEKGYNDPRWMTYNQAADKGYQVRKGEKGTLIEYWKFHDEKPVLDDKGAPVIDEETGKPKKIRIALNPPRPFRAVVFNAAQIDNVPEWKREPKSFEWEPSERAEQIIRDSGAKIFHDQGDRAYYSSSKDEIHLPGRDQFDIQEKYYGTALHELGHWTGHSSRLNRDLANPFGSEEYAKEELRAELASYFMSDRLGIPHDPGQHAAYIGSWIKVLKEDKHEIFRASRDAEQITEFLMSPELAKNVELSQERAAKEVPAQEMDAPQYGINHGGELRQNDMPALGESGYRAFIRDNDIQIHEDHLFLTEEAKIKVGPDVFVKTSDQNDKWTIEGRVIAETNLAFLVQNGDFDAVILNKIDFRQIPSVGQNITIGPMDLENPGNGRLIGLAGQEPKRQTEQQASTEKAYLDVPFRDKGAAKALGAKWEGGDVKKWYVPAGVDVEPFKKWTNAPGQEQGVAPAQEKTSTQQKAPEQGKSADGRVYLDVPFKDKGEVKALGARWDAEAKSWYAAPESDIEKLTKWLPNTQKAQEVQVDPVTAFLDVARSAGLDIKGQPVIGKLTRVSVEDGPKGNKDGAYMLHLDGRPSGYVQNFRTGHKENWTHQGHEMTREERQRLADYAKEVQAQRAVEIQKQHETLADWAEKKLSKLPMTPTDGQENRYLMRKHVHGFGVHFDGDNLVIPLRDVDGKLWSMQTISPGEGGDKHLTKNAKKEGAMHILGVIEPGKDILVAEGYATAASLHMATGKAVVMAVDSGNLDAVVGQLKERYPTSPMYVMGDDDRFSSKNVGATKAVEVSEKHQIGYGLPKFVSEGRLVDFNDLHVKEGLDAVKHQVEETISKTMMNSRMLAKDAVKTELVNGGLTDIVEKAAGDNTRHSGPFVQVGSYHAIQQVAKNEIVVHEIAKMDKKPEVGKDVTVQYRDGRGKIQDRQQDRQRQNGREIAA